VVLVRMEKLKMAREINLTDKDLESLETELVAKSAELFEEQAQFLDFLVKRAKAGAGKSKSLAEAPGWTWTWTYKF
jgi:hypothetical protein